MDLASARLTELISHLKMHIPMLLLFAIVRWAVCLPVMCACDWCIPKKWRLFVITARRTIVMCGTLALVAIVATNPPELDICAKCAHQQVQGATTLYALLVLLFSVHWLTASLAVCVLKGVTDLVAASMPLALIVGYSACDLRKWKRWVLPYVVFISYTLTHSLACHNPNHPESTHATVFATITLFTYLGTCAFSALCGSLRSLCRRSTIHSQEWQTPSPPVSTTGDTSIRTQRVSAISRLRKRQRAQIVVT